MHEAVLETLAGGLAASPFPWASVVLFGFAAALIGAFDISLPRGDVIGVSGVVDGTALVLFGPVAALVSCLLGVAGSFMVRRGVARPVRLASSLVSRLGALTLSTAILLQLRQGTVGAFTTQWVLGLAVVLSYLTTEVLIALALTSARTGRGFVRLVRGNAAVQTPFIAAQLSAATLTVLIYGSMGDWSLLLLLALLLLIRQSYAMLLEIRETFRTTVEVLAEAAEGNPEGVSGHAERVAHMAREIAASCGLGPRAVERVSYAALLHDVGRLGDGGSSAETSSSSVLEGVTFFGDVIGILRICDGVETPAQFSDEDRLAAYVVALASDIDDVQFDPLHSRTTLVSRMAVSVPAQMRARAVGAAIRLGYGVPSLT